MKFVEAGTDERARSLVVRSHSLSLPTALSAAGAGTRPAPPMVLMDAALRGTPSTMDPAQSGPFVDLADYGWPVRAGAAVWGASTYGPGNEVPMHHSATLDFITILAGGTTLLLDLADVALEQGDCVYLPGVSHGWRTGLHGCLLGSVVVGLER
jgi:hypothetical protein